MLRVIACSLILIGCGACATWEPEPEVAERMALEKKMAAALNAEDHGIICDDVQPVGSRIEKRVCTTAAQREEMHVEGKKFVERIQTNALLGNFD